MTTPYIPFSRLTATTLSVSQEAIPLASDAVLDGRTRGRCAIEVVNTSSAPVYLGDSAVDSTHGLIVRAGESRYLPITSGARSTLFICADEAVSITLAEYFA